ncbi:MAG: AAA-like domain-containing protein [Phormidesmis sp.]
MTENEALEVVKQAISPDSLSHVQEVVFKQSWAGQLYPEIARSVGYHPEYIRDVGAQLWRSLSDAMGQKVTKKNVRFVLDHLAEKKLLPTGIDKQDSDSLQTVHFQVDNLLSTEATTTQLAFPSIGLSVKSAFYLPRPPAEEQAFSELERPGGLLRIKAPSNTGKTSLLLRALDYARAQGARTVLINIQEADTAILDDLSRFLRWFCRNTAQQLNIDNKLDDYWDEEIGHKVSCKIYFREYLLAQDNEPVVLALDEVDQLFDHPALVQEFLPMLRVWHEEAMELAVWQKLRLVLSYNSEVYVPLKISQSPFNIGLSIHLPPLTIEQVQTLAERYKLNSTSDDEAIQFLRLHSLVAGHPYLIQLALYWMSERGLPLATLLDDAHKQAGIYSHHLRRHWQIMQRQLELKGALATVLKNRKEGAQIDTMLAYQLERMGLVKMVGNTAVISSQLYYLYFKELLIA